MMRCLTEGLWERSRCRKSIAYSVRRAVEGRAGRGRWPLPGVQPYLPSMQATSRAQGADRVALACAEPGREGHGRLYRRGSPGHQQLPVRRAIRRGRLMTAGAESRQQGGTHLLSVWTYCHQCALTRCPKRDILLKDEGNKGGRLTRYCRRPKLAIPLPMYKFFFCSLKKVCFLPLVPCKIRQA